MTELLVLLTPISLADSMSVVPMCIVPLAILLAGRRPVFGSAMFLAGVTIPYYLFGVFIALGLDTVFGQLEELLKKKPGTLDLVLQLLLGGVLLFFGLKMAAAREERKRKAADKAFEGMTPWQGFALGAGFTIAGAWGALPYFAAIDQILRADLTNVEAFLALGYYNLVFISIPVSLVVLRLALGERASGLFDRVRQAAEKWGRRFIIVVLMLLGLFLVVDGVGWFFDRPLIRFD